MAKVSRIETLAWNDQRITVTDDQFDLILIAKTLELREQLKDVKIGDEYPSVFPVVEVENLKKENQDLQDQITELKAKYEKPEPSAEPQ